MRKAGKSIITPTLRAFYIKNPNLANSRFAVVVGGTVAKKAVMRNRIRRVIQEATLQYLPPSVRVDMIVYPKKDVAELTANAIRKEIALLFRNIEV